MSRRIILIGSCITLSLLSCEKPGTTTSQKEAERPHLPTASAVALSTPETGNDHNAILNHPWVKLQKNLTHTTRAMIDDITSLKEGHEALNRYRAKAGLPTTSFEEESNTLIATIQEIQAALDLLQLKFPSDRYSLLNIPATQEDLYRTPLPFQVYKRIEIGETDLGIPLFLDVRAFDLSGLRELQAKQTAIQSIIDWHINLLENGVKDFTVYTGNDALALIGRGNRKRGHFDGGHGFATMDRGVFLAFLTDGKHLFVLTLDGPWKNIENNKQLFLDILNRPLKPLTPPITQPLSKFLTNPTTE